MIESQETHSFRFDYRHLAFFFIGAVAVCAFFFAMGFVVGRAQTIEVALKEPEAGRNAPDSGSLEPPAGSVADAAAKGSVTISSEPGNLSPAPVSPKDYRNELDFYSTLKDQRANQNFHPEAEKRRKASPPIGKEPGEMARGAVKARASAAGAAGSLISLQVAALRSSAEAEKLAKMLRAKGYPVFTLNPAKDDSSQLIRVQVGPYSSEAEAAKTKSRLGTDGFATITKR